jgi:hypothetical protein
MKRKKQSEAKKEKSLSIAVSDIPELYQIFQCLVP